MCRLRQRIGAFKNPSYIAFGRQLHSVILAAALVPCVATLWCSLRRCHLHWSPCLCASGALALCAATEEVNRAAAASVSNTALAVGVTAAAVIAYGLFLRYSGIAEDCWLRPQQTGLSVYCSVPTSAHNSEKRRLCKTTAKGDSYLRWRYSSALWPFGYSGLPKKLTAWFGALRLTSDSWQ